MLQILVIVIVCWIFRSVFTSSPKASPKEIKSRSESTKPQPESTSRKRKPAHQTNTVTTPPSTSSKSLKESDVFPESRKMIVQSRQSVKKLSMQECSRRWAMGLSEIESYLASVEAKLDKFITLDEKVRNVFVGKAFSCEKHWERTAEYKKHLILPLAEIMVSDHSSSVRWSAAVGIYQLGSHSVALPYLFRALDDKCILVVSYAIKSLGQTGPEDSAVITDKIVPTLMEIFKRNKQYQDNFTHERLPETVAMALCYLAEGGVLSEKNVHLMYSGLNADVTQEAREKLAKAIWITGAKAKDVLPQLIEMNLIDFYWNNLSHFDSDTVQLLVENLNNTNVDVTMGIADGLIKLVLSMADGELNSAIMNRIQDFKSSLLDQSDLIDPDIDELIGTQFRKHLAGFTTRGGVGNDNESRQRFLRYLTSFIKLERKPLSTRDIEQIIGELSEHIDLEHKGQLDEEYEIDFIQHFYEAINQVEDLDYANKRRLISRLEKFLDYEFGGRASENHTSSLRQRLLNWFAHIGGWDEVAELITNSFEDHVRKALIRIDLTELNPGVVSNIEASVCDFFRETEAKRIGVKIFGYSYFQIIPYLISWSENLPDIGLMEEQFMRVYRLELAIEFIHKHGPGSRNDKRYYSGTDEDLRQEAKDLADYVEYVQNH
mgnify:CR=1 FL=1